MKKYFFFTVGSIVLLVIAGGVWAYQRYWDGVRPAISQPNIPLDEPKDIAGMSPGNNTTPLSIPDG